MRLNKKGFVASATMYSLLILFIALIVGLLVLFANRKMILDKLKDDIKEEINMADIYNYYDSKVVYYNPVTEKFCGNYDEDNSKDGNKTGCLKWYLYDGSKGSKSVKLILDHNTTLKTSKGNVESELRKLSSEYGWHVDAKAISAEEIAKATKKSQFDSSNSSSWYYFDNNAQTETNIRKTFNYTGNVQAYNVTSDGIYRLQAWGAAGGKRVTNRYNNGGYTSGYISLEKNDMLCIYVGAAGNNSGTATFNGGGTGGNATNKGASGGGATDFRLVNGDWNNAESLRSRIMVAGGGGGSAGADAYTTAGGHSSAGGLSGINGSYYSGHTYQNQDGKGGTQTAGGAAGTNIYSSTGTNTNGSFGVGGNSGSTSSSVGAGGGGGGYYGGGPGGGTLSGGAGQGAGGGSSYISGYQGCVAVASESSSSPKTGCTTGTTDVTCSYHPSNKIFTNTTIIAGNASMPTVDGASTMTGNATNGAAVVTRISKTAWLYDNTYNCERYGCYYIDNDTNGYWTSTGSWAVSNTGKLSQVDSSSLDYGVRPAIEISKLDYGEYEDTAEYSYKGREQQFTAPKTGKYKIELWGASGGSGAYNSTPATELGGLGAYTSGTIELKENETIYLYVGGSGKSATAANNHASLAGGYNGGGNGVSGGTDDQAGAGGGATDVRLINGNWNSSYGLNSRIMVAAGGGGGHSYKADNYGNNRTTFPLMAGQKLSYSGTLGQWSNGTYSVSASQTAGNAFGVGGYYTSLEGTHGAGGGGGGYWGGITNKNNSGGPGSGGTSYISGYQGCVAVKSETNSGAKSGCSNGTDDVTCSYHYSGKKFNETNMIAGNASMPTYDGESTMTGNEGNGHAKVTLIEEKDVNVTKYYYKGKTQTFTVPKDGKYKIELWGAQGGPSTNAIGGKGSYTSGTIELKKGEKLYVNVGGSGSQASTAVVGSTPAGGFNGGANGYVSRNSCTQQAASGGGATDVRLIGGSPDNAKGLRSRIMVAAGGGGAFQESCGTSDNCVIHGGSGGTTSGLTATYVSYTGFSSLNPTGGTQTNGGQSLDEWTATSYSTTYSGSFGKGSTGNQSYSGGGGGYYGGASGKWQPGAGGSSYVSGFTGCVAVTSAESSSPKSGCSNGTDDVTCSYHYSGKKFSNPVVIAGNNLMPSYNGKTAMEGNEGNGFAKITYIGDDDDSVKDFYYKNSEQTYTVPKTGNYKLEVWGAQGGNATYISASYKGGYGGYSVGTINLTKDEVLYIHVGGKGGGVNANASASTADSNIGYNGGGYGSATMGNSSHSGGGGATHIALSSGLLKNLSGNTGNVLIAAGGGGGASAHSSAPSYSGNGGSGGGFTGGYVAGANGTCYSYGLGGTQSAVGGHTNCPTAGSTYGSNSSTVYANAAAFGLGANYSSYYAVNTSGKYYTDAGGGGGYYGGGAGWHAPGGGGSGYIGNSRLNNAHMACYNCTTSDADSTKTISVNSFSSEPESNKAKMGHGFARITYLGTN